MALMDLAEFRDSGMLQEVNRQVLHPLGVALAVEFDDDGAATGMVVIDQRDDPEGIWFVARDTADQRDYLEKASNVLGERLARSDDRIAALGFLVQPPDMMPVQEG